MAFSAGEIEAVLRLRDEMSAKLREASGVLAKFGGDAQTTTEKLSAFGSSATAAGTALSLGITAPILAAAGASLYFSGQFESTMVKLHTLAGVLSEDLQKVKDHILDLAPAVGIGPQELALAMTKISSTVSDTTTALKILDISARGSAAGLGEAVDVAGALTSVINSYGASNITAARAGDILTQAIKDGGAEAKELAPTLANVVPFAAAMGISFEEVAANIATMTKLGVPASEAVTSLTSVMTAMNKPSKEGEEALAKMGQTFGMLRQEIKDKGLAATLIDLKTRFAGNSEELIKIFGRVEGFKNLLGTAASQAETYTQVLKNMGEASKGAGVLQEAFNEITKTQEHSLKSLSAQVQVIAVRFGDALAPMLAKVVEMAKPLLEKILGLAEGFQKLDPTTQKIIIGAVALVAAIGPVLLILGQLASGLAAVIAIAPAVGAAVTFMTGPFGLFALAAVAAIGIIIKFNSNLKNLENSSANSTKETRLINTELQKNADKMREAFEASKDLGAVTEGTTVTFSEATRAQILFGDSSAASIAKLKPLAEANERAALMTEKQREAAEKQRKALEELATYSLNYADTLATVNSADQAMISTLLEHGATVAKIAEAYPRLSTAQIESVNKGVEAEKKRVDALKKANEEIVKLQQDAAAAIEALDADTLANRIKHLDTKKAADIHAAMISITTIEQQLEAIFAINKKYAALETAEQRKAADEKNKIIMAGAMLYLSIVKTNTDAAFNLTATDREKSLRAIQQNEIEKLEEIRQKTFESTGLRKLAEDEVRKGSTASVAALKIDNAALTANSKQHFIEVAERSRATYDEMKAHPEKYSKETIEEFKKIAEQTEEPVKGVGVKWKEGFKDIAASIPGIVTQAMTSGGGIVGAMKGIGVMAGAKLGEMLGKSLSSLGSMAGPIGAAVGSLAGPLIEMFTKMFDSAAKGIKKTAASYGVTIGDEMAQAIKASMKSNDLTQAAATVFNAIKLFPTIDTTNIDKALKITHDAFSMIATGQLTVAQGGKVVDDMFTKMASVGVSSTGLISKGIQEMIALNNEFGTNSKGVADFVAGQVTNAEKGFAGALAITNDAYVKRAELQASLKTATGDTSQIIKDLKEQDAIIQATGLHSQEAASAVAASLTGIVAANMASGMSFIDAVRAMAPNVDALQKQLEATGYSGGAAFNFIKEQVALANNAIAGPALQAIEGYTAGMVGLSNAGLLNQDTFSGLAGQIAGTQAALVAQGFSGQAVMLAMQGDLQTIWELQQRYGYTTDENTQALIDQGVESGLIGEQGKKDQEKILDVLMLIAEALGATLPAGLKNLGAATKTTADGMKTDLQNAAKDGLTGPNGSIASEAQIAAKELAIQMKDAARETSRVMEESSEFVSGCWSRSKNTVIEYFGEEQGVAQDVAREISKSMDESAQDSSIAFDESAADMELFMSNAAYEIDGSALDIEKSLKLAAEHAAYEFDLAAAGIQDALDSIDTSLLIDVEFDVGELTIPSGGSGGGGGGGSNNVGGLTLEQFLRNNPGDPHRYPGSGNDTDPYDYRGGLVMADGVRYLAGGGYVMYPKGTDTVPAMLTPGESVLTNGATQTLGLSAISKLNNGGTLSNDEVINELRLLRKQQAASDRQLPLLVALSVRDAMQLQR